MGYHERYYGDKCVPEKTHTAYKIKLNKPLNLGLPPVEPRRYTSAEVLALFKSYKIVPDHAEEQVNALKNLFRQAIERNDYYTPLERAEIKRYVDLVEGIVKYPYTTIADTGAGYRVN